MRGARALLLLVLACAPVARAASDDATQTPASGVPIISAMDPPLKATTNHETFDLSAPLNAGPS